jgi:cysteine-rich repeat protein
LFGQEAVFMNYKMVMGAVSIGLLLACGPVDVGLGGGADEEGIRDGVGGSHSGDAGRNSTGGTDYDDSPGQFCGDGVVQYPEECDEPPGRETYCSPTCLIRDDSGGVGGSSTGGTAGRGGSEQFCGDGVVQYPEECDEPPGRETYCSPTCLIRDDSGGVGGTAGRGGSEQFCGDGVVQYPEQCDDPRGLDPACTPDCLIRDSGGVGGTAGRGGSEQFCGDGIIQYPEECDEPPGRETYCSPTCRRRSDAAAGGTGGESGGICGDGVLDRGENCDDGNRVDGDGCSSNCLYLDSGRAGTGAGVSGRAGIDDVR